MKKYSKIIINKLSKKRLIRLYPTQELEVVVSQKNIYNVVASTSFIEWSTKKDNDFAFYTFKQNYYNKFPNAGSRCFIGKITFSIENIDESMIDLWFEPAQTNYSKVNNNPFHAHKIKSKSTSLSYKNVDLDEDCDFENVFLNSNHEMGFNNHHNFPNNQSVLYL